MREWSFWMLWYSTIGLLALLEKVGTEHFEHVRQGEKGGLRAPSSPIPPSPSLLLPPPIVDDRDCAEREWLLCCSFL